MEQHFEHTLEVRDIVLRQDDSESSWLETNSGKYYPLARVRNTVIEFQNIISFDITIGETFLPILSIAIDDEEFLLRQQDFAKGLDLITVFIGNAQDDTYIPIKQNFLITAVESSPGSAVITFEAILHVPKLYDYVNEGIEGSSFDCLKAIAEEVGLGFVSNVAATEDVMYRIRYGRNIIFIQETSKRAFSSFDTGFFVFVDQFANLNFLEITTALASTNVTYLETNVVSAERIEEPKLLLFTNNKMNVEQDVVKINHYTPNSKYGSKAIKRNTVLNYKLLGTDLDEVTEFVTENLIEQMSPSAVMSTYKSVNTFDEYPLAWAVNQQNLNKLQGMTISASLDYYVPQLFMFGMFDVEILNAANRTSKASQSPTATQDDLAAEDPAIESGRLTINESLTGPALLTSTSITYLRVVSKNSDRIGRIRQSVRLFSTNQEPMTSVVEV